MSPAFSVRIAGERELAILWEKNVRRHPGDLRWVEWREEYIGYNRTGEAVTFAVMRGDEPVGEGTLLFSPACRAIGGNPALADGKRVVNLNALRIEKPYEGQGHVSQMVKEMEREAVRRGYRVITIGVDESELRNRAIYRHWGFDRFLFFEVEDGERVLYYEKTLVPDGAERR
ncbi:MAG: GNAT family N-acetyltransferase [Clostridia bacterium]|nr:GNAT family N-acetyltransferase [Clostridia bacterium]